MNIRLYQSDDFASCVELFVETFNDEPWNDQWSLEQAGGYLQDFTLTPGFKGIVAEDDGTVNGFIFGAGKRWWSGDEFFINEMCVRSTGQRAGIGTGMFAFLEEQLTAEGVKGMALLTDRGIPAEAFYLKNGFEEIERIVFLAKDLD